MSLSNITKIAITFLGLYSANCYGMIPEHECIKKDSNVVFCQPGGYIVLQPYEAVDQSRSNLQYYIITFHGNYLATATCTGYFSIVYGGGSINCNRNSEEK